MWWSGLLVLLAAAFCWAATLPNVADIHFDFWVLLKQHALNRKYFRINDVQRDRQDEKATFPLNNLCKVYGNKNRDKKIECRNCFRNAIRNATEQHGDVSGADRECILLLPNSFQECSSDEDARECLKDKIKIYFKHKFHRFWKKWKDVFNETERGRIHQVFSFKTILRKVGEDSKEQLEKITQSFTPCIDLPASQNNDTQDQEEGRNINGLDALDAAALEGTEDEDDETFREERAESSDLTESTTNSTDQQKHKYDDDVGLPVDPQEEQEFSRKKLKLGRYIDKAFHVFLCKVKVIKQSPELSNIVRESLKTYEDVVPAEVVRALYQV